MSQSDYILNNVSASTARTKINEMVQAGASLNAGASAPSTTYAYMMWHDTTNNLLKQRNGTDNLWIDVAYVDQSGSLYNILEGTEVVNTLGVKQGKLTTQSESTWVTGTSTEETLVSPAKLKAASNTFSTGFSSDQSWTDETSNRSANATYTNNTGRMIQVVVTALGGTVGVNPQRLGFRISGFADGVVVGTIDAAERFYATEYNNQCISFNVPDGSTYRVDKTPASTTIQTWFELG